MLIKALLVAGLAPLLVATAAVEDCPGYTVSGLVQDGQTLKADLKLAGTACNVYGDDLKDLKLLVEYQTG